VSTPPTLAIVGCGPKAVAIAAKAAVLAELGWRVPRIVAIDPQGVAANWDGSNGYTDGKILLGTPPLEDVGFPYQSELEPASDESMLRLSFQAFLITQGRYAEWVDRAMPALPHSQVAAYLRWVADRVDLSPVRARVREVTSSGSGWLLDCKADHGDVFTVSADGVVITGAGRPLTFPRTGVAGKLESRVLDGQSFWRVATSFAGITDARICVVGGGETSAAIVTYLAEVIDATSRVEILTRHATVFSRSEHWRSVMYFSTAEGWADLTATEKHELIHRADRGVFSVAANRALDEAWNVAYCIGSLERIEGNGDELRAVLSHDGRTRSLPYDFVVEATGFDRLSFLDWFPDWPLERSEQAIAERIEFDLSVRGLGARLHVPGLAAMAQGPGFPHLSCLGLLADRVLDSYVAPPSAPMVARGWTTYPAFRRVEEIGRDEYERVLFGSVPPDDPQAMVPSDYLWLSLMAWCPDAEAAEVDGGFCLRMPTYHGDEWLTALVGRHVSADSVAVLLADPTLGGRLHFVPAWLATPLADDPRLVVEPDRDNFDYILDVAEQVSAEGPRFREVRRRRRSFQRNFVNASFDCAPLSPELTVGLHAVFSSWATTRNLDREEDVADERAAFARLLGRQDLERCLVGLVREDEVLSGFELVEVLPDGTAVSHFMKAARRVYGAGVAVMDAVCHVMTDLGVHRLNIEQDLGVPGLRTRKLMDKPAFLLEKYVVSAAPSVWISRTGPRDV
jgi:mycobactin lysine-N-oxygenase